MLLRPLTPRLSPALSCPSGTPVRLQRYDAIAVSPSARRGWGARRCRQHCSKGLSSPPVLLFLPNKQIVALARPGGRAAMQGPREGAADRREWAAVAGSCPAGSCRARQGCGGPAGMGGFRLQGRNWLGGEAMWLGKGVREKLDPSINCKQVFGVLISLGWLIQRSNVSGPMDAYEYPVNYMLMHKFKATHGEMTQEKLLSL